MIRYLLSLLIISLSYSQIQNTNLKNGTYSYPYDCSNDCTYKITWYEKDKFTDFEYEVKTKDLDFNSAWVAFALSLDTEMENDHVHMCKSWNDLKIVQTYYNTGMVTPDYMVKSNPSIGITNSKISIDGDIIQCKFTRANSLSAKNYFDLKAQPYYFLMAYGDYDGKLIKYHRNRASSESTTIEF